jgi:hypothetical protein
MATKQPTLTELRRNAIAAFALLIAVTAATALFHVVLS